MMKKQLVIGKTKKVALVYRPDTTAALTLSKALTAWLKERKYQVYTAPEQKIIQGTSLLKDKKALGQMSLVVVLGGDGTYLRAVRLLEGKTVPILGVNLGSLGFLTPFRADELFTAVEQTLDNKMELRPRSMMRVKLLRNGKLKHELLALNDVVIERGSLSQLINIDIGCEKHSIADVKADGLIISSPTGSTAYNLSAGGPILHPETKAIVVTSIAPHSLTSRPFIFPDDVELRFKLIGKKHSASQKPSKKGQAHFVVDGVTIDQMTDADQVIVSRSELDHLMVKEPGHNYFQLLREKLKFGDRA